MPWWIWLILSLFMLAMIVAGIAYAALHGFRALNGIAEIGSRLGKPLSELADVPQGADAREPLAPPTFTQPLNSAISRYDDAQSTSSGAGTRSANVTRVRGAVVTLQPLTDCGCKLWRGPRHRLMHAGEYENPTAMAVCDERGFTHGQTSAQTFGGGSTRPIAFPAVCRIPEASGA